MFIIILFYFSNDNSAIWIIKKLGEPAVSWVIIHFYIQIMCHPLHGKTGAGKNGNTASGSNGPKASEWNPVARQLYNAIMWVIVIIGAKPNTAIYEVKEKVWKYKSYEPFPSQVKAVNTIIGKNMVGKTLTEAIDELRRDNDIRDGMCEFDKLIDIINGYTDKNGNHVTIESKF